MQPILARPLSQIQTPSWQRLHRELHRLPKGSRQHWTRREERTSRPPRT